MSGAADDPAGDGMAGEDVLPDLSPARAVTAPAAFEFSGATFSHVFDDDGRLVPLDPIDARVANRLLIRKGTLAGVPELGSTLRAIRKIDRRTQRTVEDAVSSALSPLLASPAAIRIDRVAVEVRRAPTPGFSLAVSYTNLRAALQRARTVTL